MSRSGYSEDDGEHVDLYRNAVDRAIKGKRGQAFLRELVAALDAMPTKRLIADQLIDNSGEVCAVGAVCVARGLDVSKIDCEDPTQVADAVGLAWSMIAEIEYFNDEWMKFKSETPEQRWSRMRNWALKRLRS